MNVTTHFSLLHQTRFEPEQRWVIRLMCEVAVPCCTLHIHALHEEASSGSKKGAENTCRGCVVHAPPLLSALHRLRVARWVFIVCHYCSAVVMLGAALLIRTPLCPSAHRNSALADLPEELLRNQLLPSRFATPGFFLPPMHQLLSLPVLSPGPGVDGRVAAAEEGEKKNFRTPPHRTIHPKLCSRKPASASLDRHPCARQG